MKRKKLTAVIFFSTLLMMAGCGRISEEEMKTFLVEEDEEQPYETYIVDEGDVVKNATVACKYASTKQESLSFSVSDKIIKKVHVKNGDYVAKGQVLVELQVEDLEKKISELEYQVSHLELELSNQEELKAFDLETAKLMYEGYSKRTEDDKDAYKDKREEIEKSYERKLEDLSDNLKISRLKLDQSRKEWNEGRLIAGISGQITYLMNPLEDTFCKKDDPVVTISDLDACYFLSDEMEYASYFRENEPITIVYKDSAVEYTCEAVPVDVANWDTQMCFKPELEDIIDNGINGKINLELDRRDGVLCIPVDSLHESDKGPFVYLENNGLVEMRYVEVGLVGDTMAEILSGLSQGEIVALMK